MSEPSLCPLLHRKHPDSPSRSAPYSILCRGHAAKTLAALTELPRHYAELATLAAPSGQSAPGSRSADTPIPYREHAANHRQQIRGVVVGWARNVADDRGVNLPSRPDPTTHAPQCRRRCAHESCQRITYEIRRGQTYDRRDDVDLACEFLRRHHDWSIGQPWADDYAGEILELSEQAWSELHPSGARRITCGPCSEVIDDVRCEGVITAVVRDQADLLPSELSCDLCGHAVTADRWLTYGRKIHGAGVEALLAPAYAKLIRRIAG